VERLIRPGLTVNLFIRVTGPGVAESAAGATRSLATEQPRRGYRRIAWIERAIEPLRDQLDEAGFQRLVSALAMVIGWEALIVLQDLRGLSPDDQADVSSWAARASSRPP
jgi:hypothetical protein